MSAEEENFCTPVYFRLVAVRAQRVLSPQVIDLLMACVGRVVSRNACFWEDQRDMIVGQSAMCFTSQTG